MRGRTGRAASRPSGIVTLLSDFGLDDPYVGAVKGADNYIAAIDYNVNSLAQALR